MFREINNGGRRINVCKFPSQKNGRNIWTESIIELCFAQMCERDRNVISYSTQTARINYELDGRRRRYTSDFLIYRRDKRPLIVEVKYERQITPWFDQLFRLVTVVCDRAGYDFLIVTERQIIVEPFLSNIKTLRYYSRTPILPYHQLLCHEFLATTEEATLREICESFARRNVNKSVVLALIYHDFLLTDLSVPLGPNSSIRLSNSNDQQEGMLG